MTSFLLPKKRMFFMLNCLNSHWKIPVGYFLIDGLNSVERANLIKECLLTLHESGVKIVSLTFDGTSSNFATVRHLGAETELHNLKPHFPHPASDHKIFLVPDPSHMIKLVRNTLAEKEFSMLDMGLYFGATLSFWKSFKTMKVCLLQQNCEVTTFSGTEKR